jgi:hypothetical protein
MGKHRSGGAANGRAAADGAAEPAAAAAADTMATDSAGGGAGPSAPGDTHTSADYYFDSYAHFGARLAARAQRCGDGKYLGAAPRAAAPPPLSARARRHSRGDAEGHRAHQDVPTSHLQRAPQTQRMLACLRAARCAARAEPGHVRARCAE